MRKKKLPQMPVPPAWKCFCAISAPAALRSRAWSVPSKPGADAGDLDRVVDDVVGLADAGR